MFPFIQRFAAAGVITCACIVQAQTTAVSDPIFGIQYNPLLVHFPKAPPLIEKACNDMRGRTVFVYAHLTVHGTQYFIVQEYLGEFGVAIAVEDSHCAEIDSDRFLYEGPSGLSKQGVIINGAEDRQLMDSVAVEILNEYSQAFGGKENFLQALGKRGDTLPRSILRTELERYRNTR